MFRLQKVYTMVFCLLISGTIAAQMYTGGIGLRAGKFNTGISFKYFFNTNSSTGIQLDATYTDVASGGYTFKGFYLKQIPFKLPIVQLPLDFVVGGGVHAGYFPFEPQGYYKRERKDANYYDKSVVSGGVDALIQIEYQIKKIAPITIGIDAIPYYEFYNPGPEFIDFGVTIRYVFR